MSLVWVDLLAKLFDRIDRKLNCSLAISLHMTFKYLNSSGFMDCEVRAGHTVLSQISLAPVNLPGPRGINTALSLSSTTFKQQQKCLPHLYRHRPGNLCPYEVQYHRLATLSTKATPPDPQPHAATALHSAITTTSSLLPLLRMDKGPSLRLHTTAQTMRAIHWTR